MATVTAFTAERMKEIEDSAVVGGHITGPNLILVRHDGTSFNAGEVVGPSGPAGPAGSSGDTSIQVVTSTTRPSSPFTGLVIYETDTKFLLIYHGSWKPIGVMFYCTSTTRPGSPFQGLFIYETDTNRVFSWSGSAWVYRGGTIICTSGSRPSGASLFEGLTIYETDTNMFLIYDGANWTLPSNISGGTLGYQPKVTGQFSIPTSVSDLTGLSIAVTVPANRRIRVTGHALLVLDSGATGGVGTIWEGSSELQRFAQFSTTWSASEGSVILTPTAGPHTYKLRANSTGGGTIHMEAGSNYPAFILVEDIGGV